MAAVAPFLTQALPVAKKGAEHVVRTATELAVRTFDELAKEAISYEKVWTSGPAKRPVVHTAKFGVPRWAVGLGVLAGGYLYLTQTGRLRSPSWSGFGGSGWSPPNLGSALSSANVLTSTVSTFKSLLPSKL